MPRPYSPDPRIRVVFGPPPSAEKEGEFETDSPLYLLNPPDPEAGMTLIKRVRGRDYWRQLEPGDQLSQAEAAAFLRVSRMQVNRWVRAGKLKDRKIMGTSRITVRELVSFAEQNGIDLRPRGLWLTG